MVRERALAGPEQARIARAPRPLQGRGELSQVATDVRTGLRQPLAEPHCTGLHWRAAFEALRSFPLVCRQVGGERP